jgi:hypothetical protein
VRKGEKTQGINDEDFMLYGVIVAICHWPQHGRTLREKKRVKMTFSFNKRLIHNKILQLYNTTLILKSLQYSGLRPNDHITTKNKNTQNIIINRKCARIIHVT